MANWSVQEERRAFSGRLVKALRDAGIPEGYTMVARHYNHVTGSKVSGHSVRKWLVGEAIPRQEHIAALSTWLGCNTQWLRFGTGSAKNPNQPADSTTNLSLLHDLARLGEESKLLVRGLVDQLLQIEAISLG